MSHAGRYAIAGYQSRYRFSHEADEIRLALRQPLAVGRAPAEYRWFYATNVNTTNGWPVTIWLVTP